MKTDFCGWGFFLIHFEASKNKTPTPWGVSRKTPVWVYSHLKSGFLFDRNEIILSTTGVFRETPQGGGGFIFASLKLNQEKTPNLESGLHRL